MTSEEKKQIQELADRYKKYGYTFSDIMQLINFTSPNSTFKERFDHTRYFLAYNHDKIDEEFTIAELAALELWSK